MNPKQQGEKQQSDKQQAEKPAGGQRSDKPFSGRQESTLPQDEPERRAGDSMQRAGSPGDANQSQGDGAQGDSYQGGSLESDVPQRRPQPGRGKLLDNPQEGHQANRQANMHLAKWAGGALIGAGAVYLLTRSRTRTAPMQPRPAPRALSPLAALLGLASTMLFTGRQRSRPPLLPASAGKQATEIEKSIDIDASPEEVYDLWRNYENFPRFMNNVIEVRDLGRDRSHWVVKGPAGSQYEWDSVLTQQKRPRRLAWRSEPGADIAQAGAVELAPAGRGTRAVVRLAYQPPAGAAGEAIASLLGSDPAHELEEDLARLKSLAEGHAPAATVAGGTASQQAAS